MKNIKKYIQFAIDNGYKLRNNEIKSFKPAGKENYDTIIFENKNGWDKTINLIELITSKEFIEAIAKGLEKQSDDEGFLRLEWLTDSSVYGLYGEYYGTKDRKEIVEMELISDITKYQAIAIRDGRLEEFINNLNN